MLAVVSKPARMKTIAYHNDEGDVEEDGKLMVMMMIMLMVLRLMITWPMIWSEEREGSSP